MIVLLIAQLITNAANGDRADRWAPQALIAVVLTVLLYIEYRCYVWMGTSTLLPSS